MGEFCLVTIGGKSQVAPNHPAPDSIDGGGHMNHNYPIVTR